MCAACASKEDRFMAGEIPLASVFVTAAGAVGFLREPCAHERSCIPYEILQPSSAVTATLSPEPKA
jgi:hypothetical protein